MSATIMMPSTFDQAIREMCSEAVNQAVTALAAKHGFDAEEAMRDLGVGEIKLVRKRGPSPKKETEKSVKKQKTKDSGEPKPKRAKTGYLVYQAFARPETVAELTLLLDEGEKLKREVAAIGLLTAAALVLASLFYGAHGGEAQGAGYLPGFIAREHVVFFDFEILL